jgi:iron(III) transport system permease protein
LAIPTYIAGYTYAALLGPTGSITLFFVDTFGVRPDIVNLPGLGVVMGLVLFPYIYLPARAAFRTGMTAHMDAARSLGSTDLRTFFRVALPLARPAIAAGAFLLAMEVLNDFGAVKYYGVRTLTAGIFRSWGGLYDLGSALRLGMVLLTLVALLLWLERRSLLGRDLNTDQVPTRRIAVSPRAQWIAFGFCAFVLLLSVAMPIGKLCIDAISSSAHLLDPPLLAALGRSMLLALGAVIIVLGIALLFAYRERHGRKSALLLHAATLGYAVPGAVIAIGTMALVGPIDRSGWHGPALIGSIGLLLYAYASRFLAVGTQPLLGALRSQTNAMDHSAFVMGASPWRTFVRINLPLLRPAVIAAAMLVAIDVIKELPLTLILRPFDFETLSTSAYRFASIEQLREAARPALLIVLCAVVPIITLDRLLERIRL